MKYSRLVPIRSNNDCYTPFSGFRRKEIHKRAQSEIPGVNVCVMGIQCDSSELLEDFHDKEKPDFHSDKVPPQDTPFTNPIIADACNHKIILTGYNEIEYFAGADLCMLNKKKIEFRKIGDWNNSYILRTKNVLGHKNNFRDTCKETEKVIKTCKIIELSPNILLTGKKKSENRTLWQFQSNDKGVFGGKFSAKFQKRLKYC